MLSLVRMSFVIALVACGHAASATFTASDAAIANPERGWFVFKELKPTFHANTNNWATQGLLEPYYSRGYRLAKHIVLLPTRSGPLPQAFLDEMSAEAAVFRAAGMKVLYRFAYNWNSDFWTDDASQAVTVGHLDQLAPVLADNVDVLWAIEAGVIGRYGEMHTSSSGHIIPMTVGLSDSGKAIMAKLLAVVPQERVVGVRYPQVLFRDPAAYGSLGYQQPLTVDTAYTGSDQSRLAAWYANFGAGDVVYNQNNELVTKWAPSTAYVPMWAHCDHFQTVSINAADWIKDAEYFGYAALSNPADESHTEDIYQAWVDAAVFGLYERRLGYRYRLVSAAVPDATAPGDELAVNAIIANDGWARSVNPRRLDVVLMDTSGQEQWRGTAELGADFRLAFPGKRAQAAVTARVMLPADLTPGSYRLGLALPDPAPSLSGDIRYHIRLANTGLWQADTGIHDLGLSVTVTGAVPERRIALEPLPGHAWSATAPGEATALGTIDGKRVIALPANADAVLVCAPLGPG
ncbi:MAG: DUF4874 domain-containing protein [Planctomycetota bacterium]|jgi:hypothetical protein|nr:DUF4874 domain-containing protein [Planctomycetota bacterium]